MITLKLLYIYFGFVLHSGVKYKEGFWESYENISNMSCHYCFEKSTILASKMIVRQMLFFFLIN